MSNRHKNIFILAAILPIISFAIAIYHWDLLPSIIPIHFGITGNPDGWADKSILQVFLLPVLELLMTLLFIFVYKNPQYANIPSTMWLAALDKKIRDKAYGLIRSMLPGMLLWMNIMFTYLVYMMNQSAIDGNLKLSSSVMGVFLLGMMLWIVYWSIKVYNSTKLAIKDYKKKGIKK